MAISSSNPGINQLMASYASRWVPPWTKGPQDIRHPDTLEFCTIKKGHCYGMIGDQEMRLTPNNYVLIGPQVPHSSWTEEEGMVELVVHFKVDALQREAQALGISDQEWPTGCYTMDPEVEQILGLVGPGGPVDPKEQLPGQALANYLLRRHCADSGATKIQTNDLRLLRVIDLLNQAPEKDHKLADLAKLAGLSTAHLVRSFSKSVGMPPMAYLRNLRLERATLLIRNTDRSITDIAHATGFTSSGRLSEAFKNYHGIPPAKWRQLIRQPEGDKSMLRSQKPTLG